MAGVPVRIHWTVLVLVFARIALDLLHGPVSPPAVQVAGALLLLFSLLVHELFHALWAKRFGYGTTGVELHTFGGVASHSGWMTPRHEMSLWVVGPIPNLALGAAFGAIADRAGPELASTLVDAARFNLLIALFNVLPIWPLDGGRLLLSWLRVRVGPARADRLSYTAGLVFGSAALALGVYTRDLLTMAVFSVVSASCFGHRRRQSPPGVAPNVRALRVAPGDLEAQSTGDAPDHQSSRRQPPRLRVIPGGLSSGSARKR